MRIISRHTHTQLVHEQCKTKMLQTVYKYKFSVLLFSFNVFIALHKGTYFFCVRKHFNPIQSMRAHAMVCVQCVYSINFYSNFIDMIYIVAVVVAIANDSTDTHNKQTNKYMIK